MFGFLGLYYIHLLALSALLAFFGFLTLLVFRFGLLWFLWFKEMVDDCMAPRMASCYSAIVSEDAGAPDALGRSGIGRKTPASHGGVP